MRHILVLISVLSISVCANAEMLISMDGVINPPEVDVAIDGTTNVGLVADGVMPQGTYLLGIADDDPGSLSWEDDIIILYPGDVIFPPDPPEIPGWKSIIAITFSDLTPPIEPVIGQLVDNIIFRCEGPGNVTIGLLDSDAMLLDTQLVHQVPEPISIALLGLGAMMLRRRR